MELNEVTKRLPKHLLQFVVDQPYNSYTPVDQAVWRYVMRQNYHHLQRVAHPSYVEGLKLAGVEIENIPTMYGMNRILQRIGWAAVAVDGFIPPGAFMEFTRYNVLVIAADIRTLEHIEYTPAPDIIHESAGHAPIIAVPEFAAYLKAIGEAGSNAFSSKKDVELYEAIRHLSIIKEDHHTPDAEIEAAEKSIERIQGNMGEPSEMALIRNLHWWTVEYGLIGTLDNFKLYGAGLLSSIGEGISCLNADVKKLPYTLDAMHCHYDITKRQPQLFVTPDFAHLTTVLEQFKKLMAWTTGGLSGIQKAITSEQTATIVYSSGLQVTGTFTLALEVNGLPTYIKTAGPTALSFGNVQLPGYGKNRYPSGFTSPIGRLKGSNKPLEDMSESELSRHGILPVNSVDFSVIEFESGITITGAVQEIVRNAAGKIMLIELFMVKVTYHGDPLFHDQSYTLAVGEKIISAFAGAADIEAFAPTVMVPHEKMHKLKYNEKDLKLHAAYQRVRNARSEPYAVDSLLSVWEEIRQAFPDDWLLSLEILEILQHQPALRDGYDKIFTYLENKRKCNPHLKQLITNGLKLLPEYIHGAPAEQ